MSEFFTRYGDGSPTRVSADEMRRDLEVGTRDAADRGKIPALSENEV